MHRLVAGLSAWILLALAAPAGGLCGLVEAETHYTRGRSLVVSGNPRAAAEAFEQAIAEFPDHVEARYQLGLLYSRDITRYVAAEREFMSIPDIALRSKGRSRDDILFRSGLALGKLYARSGKYGQTIVAVRNVIASAPPGAPLDEAYNVLGLAYYHERLYDDAMFELRRALKLNPSNEDARFNLKTIRARLEHFQAGKAYSRTRDRMGAIAEFRKAIELDPRFIEARHRLGVELSLLGEQTEALKELRRAESISPSYRKLFEIWYAEGMALVALGRTDEALRLFRRSVEARPRFAAAHNEIGRILVKRDELDEAITSFATAIGADPKTDYVRNLQAAILKRTSRLPGVPNPGSPAQAPSPAGSGAPPAAGRP